MGVVEPVAIVLLALIMLVPGYRRAHKEQSGIDMSDFEGEIFADIKNLCNKLGREDQ